jgi:hypothetical protein
MLGILLESSVSSKFVWVVVGALNETVSNANPVVPATAEYGVELVVSRRAILIVPSPLVDEDVFNPIFTQSIRGIPEPVRKATP